MEYEDTETHCIPFIIKNLLLHRLKYSSSGRAAPPLFVGVNGMQGVGKTTLVSLFTSRSQFRAPHASALSIATLSCGIVRDFLSFCGFLVFISFDGKYWTYEYLMTEILESSCLPIFSVPLHVESVARIDMMRLHP